MRCLSHTATASNLYLSSSLRRAFKVEFQNLQLHISSFVNLASGWGGDEITISLPHSFLEAIALSRELALLDYLITLRGLQCQSSFRAMLSRAR